MVNGIQNSFAHPENGMTLRDMTACGQVATRQNEVIIFRSTGRWSLRWIERDYPTKNFHVKGKSSDWGPQAGFVPYLGMYSKVGGTAKEAKSTSDNDDGLHHSFAQKTQLSLTLEELNIQRTERAENRTALTDMQLVTGSQDYYLVAERSTDQQKFAFKAVSGAGGRFAIFVYPKYLPLKGLMFEKPAPLEVMTSSEVGAHNRPMTGDYDLMAVCPTWNDYGARTKAEISKPGLNFGRATGPERGATFAPGINMDGVMDMRLNTGLPSQKDEKGKWQTFGKGGFNAPQYGRLPDAGQAAGREHGDMGNLTPRILRCINELNVAMGQTGALRRVHHNAESHRNVIFGGIMGAEMEQGDAFPLTVFQPEQVRIPGYDHVITLENMIEFRNYATELQKAGFYVPRNWAWGMSIRDGFMPYR
jgi:hypothetical protein